MRFNKKINNFLTIKSDNNDSGEIWLYGDITDDAWHESDVTPERIRDALNEMGTVNHIDLRINSAGGSCVAGNTIINVLDNYKRKTGARIYAYIDGLAASMASGVAMAADYIYMAENAIFMIHKPFSFAIGNTDELQHEKEILEKVEDTLVVNYMRHFKGTEDELRQLMADESWLTADEALEYGFCDEIVQAVEVAACAKGYVINGVEFDDSINAVKDKIKEHKKEVNDHMFEYDKALEQYGVTEEAFNALNMSAENVATLASNAVNAYAGYLNNTTDWNTINGMWSTTPVENFTWPALNLQIPTVEQFITKEQAKDALGEEMDADQILALAKAGKEMDKEADTKAKAYDALVKEAIDNAVKSGIKAKGEGFNETKWRKILNTLDYAEIIDQTKEWDDEAKSALKAGKSVSNRWAGLNGEDKNTNPEDYSF